MITIRGRYSQVDGSNFSACTQKFNFARVIIIISFRDVIDLIDSNRSGIVAIFIVRHSVLTGFRQVRRIVATKFQHRVNNAPNVCSLETITIHIIIIRCATFRSGLLSFELRPKRI